jgi:RnfABCDGE-type electron transport complex G subunit
VENKMPKPIKHFFKQSWLLILTALLSGLALSAIDLGLTPRIEQNKTDIFNSKLKELLVKAVDFETLPGQVEINIGRGKTNRSTIHKALSADGKCLGWAFNAEGYGCMGDIELIIATDPDFVNLAGFSVLTSIETPYIGDRIELDYYRNQFKGAPAAKLKLSKTGDDKIIDDQITAISGATVSSQAVVDIISIYTPQIRQQLKEKGLIENN